MSLVQLLGLWTSEIFITRTTETRVHLVLTGPHSWDRKTLPAVFLLLVLLRFLRDERDVSRGVISEFMSSIGAYKL